MNNEHLVPQVVLDIGGKINSKNVRKNEEIQYILRIEAIRDYCQSVLTSNVIKKLAGN